MTVVSAPRHAVAEDLIELLISCVVVAQDAVQAEQACTGLVQAIDGWVVGVQDCVDEEPGCWSVTITKMWPGDATSPSEVIRDFVRTLDHESLPPRIAFELPTAWTVLDDPDLLTQLVPGAERILVEAWASGSSYGAPEPEIAWPTVDEPAE